MIAMNRNAPTLRSIVGRARQRGFVGLALDGIDATTAIAAATDPNLLGRAFDIAQFAGEPIWAERLARRACEVDPGPDPRLRLATFLALSGRCAEAHALFADMAVEADDDSSRSLRGILRAISGHPDDALACFDTLAGGPGGHRSASIALSTAQSLIEYYDLAHTVALVARLTERYPAHLLVRSLDLRCHLFTGDFERARQLKELPEYGLERSPRSSQRAFVEAIADSFEVFGWSNELFEFTRDNIVKDPTHWNLYGRAATAARVTSRDSDYSALVTAMPSSVRDTAGALAVLCRWQVDESHIEEASRTLDRIRSLSAGEFLNARVYLSLHLNDENQLKKAFSACIACGMPLLNASISYSVHTYYFGCSVDRFRDCLAKLEPFDRSAPTNIHFWQIYLRCLVGVGEEREAEVFYRALPSGLRNCSALRPFAMFFDVLRGRHDKARKDWLDYIRTTRHRCVNAPSSYPKTVQLKYCEKPGAILLFTTLYNGIDYIDWFLGYYRALGVNHFFITDNGSTDGSLERLCVEADVSVFSNPESFAAAGFGVLWVNHLMQRFGVDHWCFHVDLDEGFVFPECDRGRSLRELLSYCDDCGFGCVPAVELDMYPDRLASRPDIGPFEASCYFDTDYEWVRSELPPYVMIRGGLRARLTGLAVLMQKSPLIRMASDVRYVECNHATTHLPVADITGALLHYKFVGDMRKRVEEAISRAEHFAGAIFYRQLNGAVSSFGWSRSLLSQHSQRYEGTESLALCGLIKGSSRWDGYFEQHPREKSGRDGRTG